ncbi:MAG: MATE family efflux transporter [Planctomycetota bacterium]
MSTAPPPTRIPSHDEDADPVTESASIESASGATAELGGRLAGLPLWKQVAVLAIWPFFQQVLAFLVNFVDTAIAGRLSVEATNAIAIAAYFGWFLFLMTSAVGTGGAALIARAIGAKHRGLANAGLAQSFVIALLWSALIGTLVFVGADFIGGLAQLEGQSRDLCAEYLRIIALAAPATAILAIGVACLSAAGDTRTPFLAMLAFNAVNVAASVYLAVSPWRFGLFGTEIEVPGLGLGVPGIAWGTAIATVVGAALILIVLLNPKGPIRLRWFRLRPHLHTIRRIVRVALPSLGEGVGHWSGNFLALMAIGLLGQRLLNEAYPGAHIVAIRIEALSFLPAMALATAAGTLTGQYLGAGSVAMAKKAAVGCWLTAAIPMTLLGLTFIAVPQWWVGIVSTQPEHFELAPRLIQICGFVQFFFGSSIVLSGAMRGAGDTRRPMLMTVAMTWGVRLPLVLVVTLWLGGLPEWLGGVPAEQFDRPEPGAVAWLGSGLAAIWCVLCGELILRGIVFIAVFFRGGWAKVDV